MPMAPGCKNTPNPGRPVEHRRASIIADQLREKNTRELFDGILKANPDQRHTTR